MEVKIAGEPVLETDIDFGDLLDKVEMAFTVHFEGRKGRGGFLFDLTAIGLSNEVTFSGGSGPSAPPDGTVVKADVDLSIVEVGGFYRPSGEKTGLDILRAFATSDSTRKSTSPCRSRPICRSTPR
jgi:hypothetical protein